MNLRITTFIRGWIEFAAAIESEPGGSSPWISKRGVLTDPFVVEVVSIRRKEEIKTLAET